MTTDPFRDAFERMAPRPVDPSRARAQLGALTPGFQKARRMHRVRLGAASAVCALGIAVGGPAVLAAVAPGQTNPAIDFASPGESTPDIADAAAADAEQAASVESAGSSDFSNDDLDVGDAGEIVETREVGLAGSSDDEGSDDDVGSAPTPEVTVAPPAVDDDDENGSIVTPDSEGLGESEGGTVAYQVVDGALVLGPVEAADGYEAVTVKDTGEELKVRFVSDDATWEIEVELDDGVAEAKAKRIDPEDPEDSDEDEDEDD